jgi:hypothetical protein
MVRPFTSSIAFGRSAMSGMQLRLEARRQDDAPRRLVAGEEEALLVRLQLGHPDQRVDLLERGDPILDARHRPLARISRSVSRMATIAARSAWFAKIAIRKPARSSSAAVTSG